MYDERYMNTFFADKPEQYKSDFLDYANKFININIELVSQFAELKFSEKVVGVCEYHRHLEIFYIGLPNIDKSGMFIKSITKDGFKIKYREEVLKNILG
jgi:hypothetical protein